MVVKLENIYLLTEFIENLGRIVHISYVQVWYQDKLEGIQV